MIYSGFFRRALAFILDMIISSIPAALLFLPLLGVQAVQVSSPDQLSQVQLGVLALTLISWQVISVLVTWLYFALLESGVHQATWGKRIFGIKVVGKDGGRISFGRATGRFFAKTLSYAVLYIGFIMAGFTQKRQSLHDMIAETYVVKKEFKPGQELPAASSRKLMLWIVCILWVLLVFGMSALSSKLSLSPTQAAAQQSAQRLYNLAAQNSRLQQPIRLEGATFYQTQEGYRSVVLDPSTSNKFTLLLKNGSNQVCCQAFPLGDCADTGFELCEK